jgi:hypothetical protein
MAIKCVRCNNICKPGAILSAFDLEFVCLECNDLERAHPDYDRAATAAFAAVQRRDRSFRGIGRPSELRPLVEAVVDHRRPAQERNF